LQHDGPYWFREEFRKLSQPPLPHLFLTSVKQFIEAVTGIKGTVHHDLRPQKTKISVTKLYFPEFDCDIHFVDTPGFGSGDGTDESEADIFDMISKWMIKSCAIDISS